MDVVKVENDLYEFRSFSTFVVLCYPMPGNWRIGELANLSQEVWMDWKKLIDAIGKWQAIIGFVGALAALLGIILAPQYVTYAVVFVIWLIVALVLWGIWKFDQKPSTGLLLVGAVKAKRTSKQYIALGVLVALTVLTLGWLSLEIWKNRPSTYTVAPFADDKFGILLAEFTQDENGKPFSEGRLRRDELYDDMERMVIQLNLENLVEIQKYSPIYSEKIAQKTGESLNADLVVWGFIPTEHPNEMRPSFAILSNAEDMQVINPKLFAVQIAGDSNTSILTNRVRAVTCYVLALLFLNSGQENDLASAITALDQGILEAEDEYKKNPDRKIDLEYNLALFYTTRGRAHAALDDQVMAEEDFKQALQYRPDFTRAYSGIGNIYYLQNDLDKAYSNYQKVLPYWSGAYGLGLVSYTRGEYQRAADYFQQALTGALKAKYPENSTTIMRIHFSLGMSYKALGMFRLSELQLQMVCSSKKTSSELKNLACTALSNDLYPLMTSSLFTPTMTMTSTPTMLKSQTPILAVSTSISTPTPELIAYIVASSGCFRKGPDDSYPCVSNFHLGDKVIVIGRNLSTSWFLVKIEDGHTGWLYKDWVVAPGINLTSLPTSPSLPNIPPSSLPTSRPDDPLPTNPAAPTPPGG